MPAIEEDGLNVTFMLPEVNSKENAWLREQIRKELRFMYIEKGVDMVAA